MNNSKSVYKILITGSTGLVGSKFVYLAKDKFKISTIGRENVDIKIDLTSKEDVVKTITSSDADAVINFAAYTNVDGAEEEKNDKDGEVYKINSMMPKWVAEVCKTSGKSLFHVSTDYVFDGKQSSRPYTEDDLASPVDSWYSMTKYYGEENILKTFQRKGNFAILRISYPYSGVYQRKLDIARVVVDKLKKGEPYFGINDQKIKPTSVDDIAEAVIFLLEKQAKGIYHVAGNFSPEEYITPLEFAQKIAEIMKLNISLISATSFLELSKKRLAPRPQNTWLSTKKIEALGFRFNNIDEALKRFKQQLEK